MKIVSAEEAVAGIRSGDQVYVQCAAATPSVLLDALVARAPELHNVEHRPPPHARVPGRTSPRRWRPTSATGRCSSGPNARKAVNEGRAEFVPVFLSDVPHLFRAGSSRSTPCSSTSRRPTRTASARSGPRSRRCTRRSGPPTPSSPRSTARCRGRSARASSTSTRSTTASRSTSRRTCYPPPVIGEVERRIGEFVADLVPDGATLQMGIGAIPTAVALSLRDKKDLGIHTEMMTDCVVDLVEAGVVTGMAKERNRGKIVCTFMMGTREAVPLRRRQPDGRDAGLRLHERHARDPRLPADDRDQLGDRGRPHRPGLRRLDRLAPVQRRRRPDGLHPRRGARAGGPRDHRPARRPRPTAASRGSRRSWRRAPAW